MTLHISVTDVVAWIGALTGIAALVWQIATWRRSAHRVIVEVSNSFLTRGNQISDHMIGVTAINTGASAVTVTGWGIRMGGRTADNANQLVVIPEATPLPHRLESGAQANFFMLAEAMRDTHRERGLPYSQMRPWVRLATGQQVFARKGVLLKD